MKYTAFLAALSVLSTSDAIRVSKTVAFSPVRQTSDWANTFGGPGGPTSVVASATAEAGDPTAFSLIATLAPRVHVGSAAGALGTASVNSSAPQGTSTTTTAGLLIASHVPKGNDTDHVSEFAFFRPLDTGARRVSPGVVQGSLVKQGSVEQGSVEQGSVAADARGPRIAACSPRVFSGEAERLVAVVAGAEDAAQESFVAAGVSGADGSSLWTVGVDLAGSTAAASRATDVVCVNTGASSRDFDVALHDVVVVAGTFRAGTLSLGGVEVGTAGDADVPFFVGIDITAGTVLWGKMLLGETGEWGPVSLSASANVASTVAFAARVRGRWSSPAFSAAGGRITVSKSTADLAFVAELAYGLPGEGRVFAALVFGEPNLVFAFTTPANASTDLCDFSQRGGQDDVMVISVSDANPSSIDYCPWGRVFGGAGQDSISAMSTTTIFEDKDTPIRSQIYLAGNVGSSTAVSFGPIEIASFSPGRTYAATVVSDTGVAMQVFALDGAPMSRVASITSSFDASSVLVAGSIRSPAIIGHPGGSPDAVAYPIGDFGSDAGLLFAAPSVGFLPSGYILERYEDDETIEKVEACLPRVQNRIITDGYAGPVVKTAMARNRGWNNFQIAPYGSNGFDGCIMYDVTTVWERDGATMPLFGDPWGAVGYKVCLADCPATDCNGDIPYSRGRVTTGPGASTVVPNPSNRIPRVEGTKGYTFGIKIDATTPPGLAFSVAFTTVPCSGKYPSKGRYIGAGIGIGIGITAVLAGAIGAVLWKKMSSKASTMSPATALVS